METKEGLIDELIHTHLHTHTHTHVRRLKQELSEQTLRGSESVESDVRFFGQRV